MDRTIGDIYGSNIVADGQELIPCDGRWLRSTRYPDLFDVLGATYGAEHVTGHTSHTRFAVPDLRGRVANAWADSPYNDSVGTQDCSGVPGAQIFDYGRINDMPTLPDTYLDNSRASQLQRQIAALQAELDRVENFGPDFEDGAVIRFQKQFALGGRVYDYAAIRANGTWFTTGPNSPKSYGWVELREWIGHDEIEVALDPGGWVSINNVEVG